MLEARDRAAREAAQLEAPMTPSAHPAHPIAQETSSTPSIEIQASPRLINPQPRRSNAPPTQSDASTESRQTAQPPKPNPCNLSNFSLSQLPQFRFLEHLLMSGACVPSPFLFPNSALTGPRRPLVSSVDLFSLAFLLSTLALLLQCGVYSCVS